MPEVLTNAPCFCYILALITLLEPLIICETMAFSIPAQAFLSFSKKQALDSLWRLCGQWEKQEWNSEQSNQNKSAYLKYLDTLLSHESSDLRSLAKELLSLPLEEPRDLETILMALERLLKKDITEDEFLITTEDTNNKKSANKQVVHLVLDNLRSSFNVGSLFRSGEAFGVTKIHLCGYTATPENSKTAKAALGAEDWVEWVYWENTLDCLDFLSNEGLNIYAFETCDDSTDLSAVTPIFPLAIVLGNERYGLATPTLKRAHYLLNIPLCGRKNSLNVSVCGAIALQRFLSVPTS